MTNRKTHEADHNEMPIDELLQAFHSSRAKTVAKFEQLDESDWGKAALALPLLSWYRRWLISGEF